MPQLFQRRGAETLVNTITAGGQSSPHVAALANGGYVVAWTSPDTGGSVDVKAQRFDANGNAVGGEFLVNSAVASFQGQPKVVALDNGGFVVVWANINVNDPNGDGPDTGIKGQIYNPDGTPSGGEFLVNTAATGMQQGPAITTLAGGGFVVSWQDPSQLGGDTSGSGIKAQIFDAAGMKIGSETLLNTVTAGSQVLPAMTALASGGFAATWFGGGIVRMQLFDAAGAKVGSELPVSTSPVFGVSTPSVTQLADGKIIVTWAHSESISDADGFDLSAQLFDAAGTKIGGEFQVNTQTAGDQRISEVTALPDGSFLITWQGPGASGTGIDLHGQVFDSAGSKVGVEFIVNGVTSGDQTGPRVAVLASGDIVATWGDTSGIGGDATGSAVKSQIFTLATSAPSDIALSNETVSETHVGNTEVATLSATGGAINASFTYTIVSDSSGGAFRIEGDRLVVDDNRRLDFESQPVVDLRIRATDLNGHSYEEVLHVNVADAAVETRYLAQDEQGVPVDSAGLQGEPDITTLSDGRSIVVWSPNSGNGLRGRFLDADGQPTGTDLVLTDFAFGSTHPTVALPGGGFVMTWQGKDAGGNFSLVGQVFNAAGAPVGAKFAIDPGTGVDFLDAAMADGGHFVVAYTSSIPDDAGSPGPFQQIRAQIFNLTGAEMGADFRVNTTVAGEQIAPRVASLPGGGFVIAWEDGSSGADGFRAQMFNAGGGKIGTEIEILPGTAGIGAMQMSALTSGGFVATWTQLVDEGGPTEHSGIYGQIVGADGVKVGSAFLIDAVLSNYGPEVTVEAMPDGGFVVSWYAISLFGDGEGDAVIAQLYTAAGQRVGEPFVVNDVTRGDQVSQDVTVDSSGNLTFVWSDIFLPANGTVTDANIMVRRFEPSTIISGTSGDDTIQGTGGDDFIEGLGGNDVLNGGVGNDQLKGGAGDDIYVIDGPGDTIVEYAGQGFDIAYINVASYTLAAGSEVEWLSGIDWTLTTPLSLTGNALAQSLYGNAGANVLNGNGGGDTMFGFGGDDTYVVNAAGDTIIENAGQGFDSAYVAGSSYTLAAGSEVELISAIDWSSTGALSLIGNALAQSLYGNAGANVLNGNGGGDTMFGFGGNDVYVVNAAGDMIFESGGQGFDIAYVTTSAYALTAGSEVEWLSAADWSSTAALSLIGNELAQSVYGNAGANLLNGNGGGDTMFGFGGDDVYIVNAGDTIVETAGNGFDVAYVAAASYVLTAGSEVERLSAIDWTSTSALSLTGNELAQSIYGNAGANTLDGKGGSDTLGGMGGIDTFAFTTALGPDNVDTILDFQSGTDKIALDDAVFAALGGLGALDTNAFYAGTGAHDADDRIIYDQSTGNLYYDADGDGAAAAMLFATLQGAPALVASDFTVI